MAETCIIGYAEVTHCRFFRFSHRIDVHMKINLLSVRVGKVLYENKIFIESSDRVSPHYLWRLEIIA